MQRTLVNNNLLAKEQAKTSDFLTKSLGENEQLVKALVSTLHVDCARSKQGIATYVQARKEATAYRLKAQFDEAAYGLLDEFTVQFNEKFAPLDTKTAELGKELATLQTPEFADDLGHAVKVSEKKREMMGNALFLATSNVRLRDKMIERIGKERSQLFTAIDARIAAVQAPSEDCEALTQAFTALTAQLAKHTKAVADHQAALADLYAAQHAELDVIMQYANRPMIYKLVIAGASGAVADKISGLSDRLTETLAGADAKVGTLLDQAQSHFIAAADKFSVDLNGTATSLQTDLTAAVNRGRVSPSDTHGSGK